MGLSISSENGVTAYPDEAKRSRDDSLLQNIKCLGMRGSCHPFELCAHVNEVADSNTLSARDCDSDLPLVKNRRLTFEGSRVEMTFEEAVLTASKAKDRTEEGARSE